MNFLIDFVTYLVAFGLGSALTWLVLRRMWPARSADEAFTDVDEPREAGEKR